MDIRPAYHDTNDAPHADTRHGRPAMRTLALALALAALPAIGAGIDQAATLDTQATPATTFDDRTATAMDTIATTRPALPETADTVAPVELVAEPEPAAPEPAIQPDPVEPDPLSAVASLEPGEFVWQPEVSPDGPVVVVVSLPEQLAHVYRDGVRIGVSTVSSGKPGHDTPTGTYPILQKRVEHYSNLYDNAPMPYMQRLTWDGIALHAGRNPGYPASHGCIRLPREFAELLYDVTRHGTTVVVADEASHSADVVRPGTESPVDSYTGLEMPEKADVAALAQFGAGY